MLWEKFEEYLIDNDTSVLKNSYVTNVSYENDFMKIDYESDNESKSILAEHVLFSNPLLDFINFFKEEVPDSVIKAADNLNYRNHISVHVTIDQKLFDDNWIYIHSPNLKMARIADFTNFSKHMSKEGTYPITLEYFCFEDDVIWNDSKENIIEFGRHASGKVRMEVVEEGSTEELLTKYAGAVSLDETSISEVMFLTKFMGNYNIQKLGENLFFTNGNRTKILKRI